MKGGVVVLLFALFACKQADTDVVADTDIYPWGLDERPANPDCVAMARPPSDANVKLTRTFPSLSFTHPVGVMQAPNDPASWYVIDQTGRLVQFADDPSASTTTTFADIRSEVTYNGTGEEGLLGAAFDPKNGAAGPVYLFFSTGNSSRPISRLSRFQVKDGVVDVTSEQILLEIQKKYSNHNGGNIVFGPDGFLYLGIGDGGSANDPDGNGQNTNVLLAKMLRIDVSGTGAYTIPPDNPFADGVSGRPEIYAWGMRNPWRWSFDSVTGDLWVGDVGQDTWEEVDEVVRGGNYGWNAKEASHCFAANPCDGEGWIDPIVEYNHTDGKSITGGVVVRGGPLSAALEGSFLYADYVTGKLWAVVHDAITGDPSGELLLETGVNISSFGRAADGRVLVVGYDGTLYQLEPASGGTTGDFPTTLSATGCTKPGSADPTDGLVPYGVAAPFWSDGAEKSRWLAIPDGTTIAVGADGDFALPIGSVVRKDFHVGGTLAETRLLVHHDDDQWAGYTYAWNADGTDATWVPAGQVAEVGGKTWRWPTSAECLRCHTAAAGRTLGLESQQLDGNFDYGARHANQLDTLSHIGLLASDPPRGALPSPAGDDSVDARARSWLHTNCSQCHRPGGPGGGTADYRYGPSLSAMGICDADPQHGDLGVSGARIVVPGDPEHSLLYLRIVATDAYTMPPLGHTSPDPQGAALVAQWIRELTGCSGGV
jgi:uncharacterized repeat protein (TIGR03806 family)